MDLGEELRTTEQRERDVMLAEHESVALLTPRTGAGRAWIDKHIGAYGQPYYPVVIAEPENVLSIVTRMRTDGLDVGPPDGWDS
jgi:hypothetical protein